VVLFAVGAVIGTAVGPMVVGRRAPDTGLSRAKVPPEPGEVATEPPDDWVETPLPEVLFAATPERPTETPHALDAGLPEVFCFFDVPEAAPNADVEAQWVRAEGASTKIAVDVSPEEADHLRGHFRLTPPDGTARFAPGIYELGLIVDGRPAAEASFAVVQQAASLLAESPAGERFRPELTNVTLAAGGGRPQGRRPFVLPSEPPKVTVRFRYAHAVAGTTFTVRWLYEDGLIAQATSEINIQQAAGEAEAWFAPQPPATLPNGKYGVLITLAEGTAPLAQETFWVGRTPSPNEAAGGR